MRPARETPQVEGSGLLLRPFMPGQAELMLRLERLRKAAAKIMQHYGGRIVPLSEEEVGGVMVLGPYALEMAKKNIRQKVITPGELQSYAYDRLPATRAFSIYARSERVTIFDGSSNRKKFVGLRVQSHILQEEVYTALNTVNALDERTPALRNPNGYVLLGKTTDKGLFFTDARKELLAAGAQIIPAGSAVHLAPVSPPAPYGVPGEA